MDLAGFDLHRGHGARDVEQLLDSLGWLSAFAQPVGRLLIVDLDQRGLLKRVITTDLLYVAAVPGGTPVNNHDAVDGLLLLAHSHQSHLDGHQLTSCFVGHSSGCRGLALPGLRPASSSSFLLRRIA